jgi:Ribonuclease R winged-helix domain
VDAHDRQTDIDLQILDLLRQESPKSAYRLAQELTRRAGEEEEPLGTHTVRKRLEALASRGLVGGSASAHPAAAGRAKGPALADPWRITEEGRALIEPEAGVASAPYDREVVGGEEEGGGRDAGFWVLIAIAVVTAACAAYSLLVASGVLGGA